MNSIVYCTVVYESVMLLHDVLSPSLGKVYEGNRTVTLHDQSNRAFLLVTPIWFMVERPLILAYLCQPAAASLYFVAYIQRATGTTRFYFYSLIK